MAWCQGCSSVKIDPQLSHQDTPSLSLVIFCCGFQGYQRLHKDDVTIRIKWLHRSWAPCFFLEHDNKILFLWWPLQIRHGAWLVLWISFVSRPLPSWTGKPWSQLLYRCPLLRWLPGGMHPLNAVQVDFDTSGLHWCCIASIKWIHFGSSKKITILNLISCLITESWACSLSFWIRPYNLFTSSCDDTDASYLNLPLFSKHRERSLFFDCSFADTKFSGPLGGFQFQGLSLCLQIWVLLGTLKSWNSHVHPYKQDNLAGWRLSWMRRLPRFDWANKLNDELMVNSWAVKRLG